MTAENETLRLVLAETESRRAAAEQALEAACLAFDLPRILRGFGTWALAGGSVRDTLLAPVPGTMPPVPDLDIVVGERSALTELAVAAAESGGALMLNSYGGLKASLPGKPVIDLWSWDRGRSEAGGSTLDDWRLRLEQVDYGLNGALFVWPDRRVVLHPQWLPDLRAARVELAARPRWPEHTVIRAVALAAKLEARFGCRFRLGPKLRRRAGTLGRDPALLDYVRRYAQTKIAAGRWTPAVLDRLAEECGSTDLSDCH